ncbi:hypothetical protein HOLDEFILI_02386 [Holdemania filiformis DSM 12042]|uniref:Uncharacterized protein n=1 Tax=Holdemania filiformis DSM 12042 TaxID=545696 RepID=B9Y981_9FIRM|nr:hypothetical protein HOLDEFILI_02386 [Holdemania filiformis DSM 12042]
MLFRQKFTSSKSHENGPELKCNLRFNDHDKANQLRGQPQFEDDRKG